MNIIKNRKLDPKTFRDVGEVVIEGIIFEVREIPMDEVISLSDTDDGIQIVKSLMAETIYHDSEKLGDQVCLIGKTIFSGLSDAINELYFPSEKAAKKD